MLKTIILEIRNHFFIYSLLFLILIVAAYVRIYNVNNNLGFYYDQGRDALVIWDFLKHGNLFLIGPTTGIAGIFRGPWYYWLITPLYFIGNGNPVYPAIFLSMLSIAAIFFLFLVAKELMNNEAGILAAGIAALSYYVVVHSRWLSNPNPMLLISILLFWSMLQVLKRKAWGWPMIGFLAGLSIQFGSATEVFYVLTVLIFAYVQSRSKSGRKLFTRNVVVVSFALFFLTFVPQIIFDVLKHGVLSKAVLDFLLNKGSFQLTFWQVSKIRVDQYYELFMSVIFPGDKSLLLPFVLLGFAVMIFNIRLLFIKPGIKWLLLFILIPLIGMLFFQGNYGNVFDYYFSGLYFPLILLFALPLGYAAKNWGGKLVIITFFILFLNVDTPVVSNFVKSGRTHFTYSDQKKIIEWISLDARGKAYNVDVYVPPVIPYAYDYLFKWYSSERKVNSPLTDKQVPLLYTVYELDPPSPDRLEKWLSRQMGIGKVEKEYTFGGITVQRRRRI